jgi:hypothetical protein
MINKKIFLSLLISFMFLPVYLYAFEKNILSGTENSEDKRAVVTSIVSFGFIDPNIEHIPVSSVSAADGILNIKSSVNFGSYVSAKAQMKYYFNDNPSSTVTVDKGDISNNTDFYMAAAKFKDSSYEKINYQIKIKLKKKDDETDYFLYWPQQLTASSDTFHTAQILTETATIVEDTNKETIAEFQSGNQEYGNTKVIIPANGLNKSAKIIIRCITIASNPNLSPVARVGTVSKVASSRDEMVALYEVFADNDAEILKAISATFYYGAETSAKSFVLKYRKDENSDWKKVEVSNVDTQRRTISSNTIKEFGQYGIFINNNLSDNSYRPEKRTRLKARIASGVYDGFEFKYLEEGDIVKIYSINGKKVAELTSASSNSEGFVWKGKKGTDNNGDWAESGTYVYQIKLKGKGKIISGTIAFIW